MFSIMDKYNVFAIVIRGGGSSGGGGSNKITKAPNFNAGQNQYTATMKSVGYHTQNYSPNYNANTMSGAHKAMGKSAVVAGGIALGAGGPSFAARAAGGAITYAAGKAW